MLTAVLDLARRELGVTEEPAGSNTVKYNAAYYGRTVAGDAYPWCCVFLWWLFRETGLAQLFYGGKKTASCGALARWARARGQFVTGDYRPGDVVFFHFGTGVIQHVGLLERVEGGVLVTIEGNTGLGNDANGGAVMRRWRQERYAAGAWRPPYQEETMTQERFDEMMTSWLARQAGLEPGDFSAEARAWAEEAGLILGDKQGEKQYRSFCTREQLVTILHRLVKKEDG